jgi:pyruvate dehydrogenase E1 component beta subunit
VADGDDITLISYGPMVRKVLEARELLAKDGISAQVIDLRTVAPFDLPTLISNVAKTRRALVVHEAVLEFGVGAEIAARLSEHFHGELKAPVRRIGSAYSAVPFSKPLESAYVPDAKKIRAMAQSMMS